VNSALAAIQGKVAGVNIVRASGQPGAGVNILLRSPTAFEESNSPLFVIDGVVMSRDLNRTTADIEALDIVDVEVIKGAPPPRCTDPGGRRRDLHHHTARPTSQSRADASDFPGRSFGQDFLAAYAPSDDVPSLPMNAAGTRLVNADGRDTTWNGRDVPDGVRRSGAPPA